MDSQKEPGIRINQIFLNRAVLEHGQRALELPSDTPLGEHKLSVTYSAGIAEDGQSGIATVAVQSLPDDTALYQFTVELVALVSVDPGNGNLSLADYLQTAAAPTMYPFLREAVANLTGRGRFGPVWLKPMNFTVTDEDAEKVLGKTKPRA